MPSSTDKWNAKTTSGSDDRFHETRFNLQEQDCQKPNEIYEARIMHANIESGSQDKEHEASPNFQGQFEHKLHDINMEGTNRCRMRAATIEHHIAHSLRPPKFDHHHRCSTENKHIRVRIAADVL